MAKNKIEKPKIVDVTGATLTTPVKPLKGVRPTGNFVLVEVISENELAPSPIFVQDNDKDSNQAYVLDIGPLVNKEWGIKVGDRVLLQGSFIPCPSTGNEKRNRHVLLPDMIKAVLLEE